MVKPSWPTTGAKISLDDMEILRKYRVQSRNFYVSSSVEEFTCGAHVTFLNYKGPDLSFGVSKRELRISDRQLVSGLLGNINGGS